MRPQRRARRSSLVIIAALALGCGTTENTLDTTPPEPPTRQRATVTPSGDVALSWRAPSAADFASVLVVRYAPGADFGKPSGQPSVGAPLGTGVVRFSGSSTSFIDTDVPRGCGPYTYHLWASDVAGNWSQGAAAIELPRGATTAAPTSPVTDVTLTRTDDGTLELTWANPAASTGFFQASVVRKPGSAAATVNDGTSLYNGTESSTRSSELDLVVGQQNVFAVFACNACGACTAPATATFTRAQPAPPDAGPPDAGPPPPPGDAGGLPVADAGLDGGGADAGFDAGHLPDRVTPTGLAVSLSVTGQDVQLRWTNAPSSDLVAVKVLRVLNEYTPAVGESQSTIDAHLNAPPTGPTDSRATLLTTGLVSTASERVDQLLPDHGPARRRAVYVVYGCTDAGCEPSGPTVTFSLSLAQALRGGGYTLFWRHATATVCGDLTNLCPSVSAGQTCAQALAGQPNDNWWRSCASDCSTATARQLDGVLSAQETAAVHDWFTSTGVAMGRVLSSEFCRGFQTAQGFNFGPTVELTQDLTYWVYDEANRCPRTVRLLNAPPAPGTNTGMVSHAGFICPSIDSLNWGEAAIYKPQAPSTRACTGLNTGCTNDEACVNSVCVHPLYIGRVTALAWQNLP